MSAQKIMRTEGIEENANQENSEANGVTPSAKVSLQRLLQLSPRAQAKKSGNFLQKKKIIARMAEKEVREYQKAVMAEQIELERQEEALWQPVDKKDAKFQMKQSKKSAGSPRGQKKQLKKMLEEQDEIENFSKKQNKVTSAWKRRS